MTGIVPRYSVDAPVSYTTKTGVTITGGQLVEATTGGVVQVGTAGSTKVLGVATKDSLGTDGSVGTTPYSAFSLDASFPTNLVTVAHGHFAVAYAAAATFGAKLKAAASGGVTPWVSGTDAADLIVGVCTEVNGVAGAGTFLARIY